jgi:aquaporin Z
MSKYVVEFIGTFFLVFTVGMVSIDPGAGALAPIAIGSVLAVMIYAGGHISGAHYNPAFTLAIWLRGKATLSGALAYMTAQVLAGVAAAVVVLFLKENSATGTTYDPLPALVAEFLFTFAIAFVVLNVATARSTEGNNYFGFAIGFTVLAGAYAVGSVSGGVFNPAVAVGITIMGVSELSSIWIYLVATLAGGAVAALAFNALKLSGD